MVGVVLCAMIFALCSSTAGTQQPKKIPQIGFLVPGSLATYAARTEAFRQGLRELGYVEGKDISVEYRYAMAGWSVCRILRPS